jgi:signal transduction histidine kinase
VRDDRSDTAAVRLPPIDGVYPWRWDARTGTWEWLASSPAIASGTAGDAWLDPADREAWRAALAACAAGGGPLALEVRARFASGEGALVLRGTASDGGAGVQPGVVGVAVDVSGRRSLEDRWIDALEQLTDHGQALLTSLCDRLAGLLGADIVFVAATNDASLAEVRACVIDRAPVTPFVYDLAGTPCERVANGDTCFHPDQVQAAFPTDQLLVDMGVHAYAGAPIVEEGQRPMGMLVALWRSPPQMPQGWRAALRLFAARAASELTRMRAETERLERAKRLERFQLAQLALSRDPRWQRGDRDAASRAVLETAGQALGCARTSYWLIAPGGDRIDELLTLDHRRGEQSCGARLLRSDTPRYFAALAEDRTIVAVDAETDPRTAEFRDIYLRPQGVRSMLDVPVRVREQQVGVLCFEDADVRDWMPEEQSFAASLGDFVALAQVLEDRRSLEQQLLHAQKLESVGRLAGGVAHDFNNLLTAIGTGVELAREPTADGTYDLTLLDDVSDAVKRAAALTRQLLSFARKSTVQSRPVDVVALVRGAERLFQRLIGATARIAVSAPEGPLVVVADPGQLEQVLVNLVVNARDALPRGGTIELHVSSRRGVSGLGGVGDAVVLEVRDDGEGMPPEVRDHIFEPFFTTKAPGTGTGLGLATCYGIVQQLGGRIEVETEVGRGTTFTVLLPKARGDATEAPAVRELAGLPALAVAAGARVLLVEDDEHVRALIARALHDAGYEVVHVARPSEALAALDQATARPFDAMLTDLVMPEMDGVMLAAEVRLRRPEMRVLYLSGYTPRVLELEPGRTESLDKPFTPQRLLSRVAALVGR